MNITNVKIKKKWAHECEVCGMSWTSSYAEPIHACVAGVVARHLDTPPTVRGDAWPSCVHRKNETGEHELIKCETCLGNVQIKYPIHACDVHQICLPTYTGKMTETMTCHKCRAESLGFEAKEPKQ